MASTAPGRTVYTLGCAEDGHEAASHDVLARRLAGLLGFGFGGPCETVEVEESCFFNCFCGCEERAQCHPRSTCQ